MAKRKTASEDKGTVAKTAEAVKNAVVKSARATAQLADEYVVEPTKNILGLGKNSKTARKSKGPGSSARTMSAGVQQTMGKPKAKGAKRGKSGTQRSESSSGSSGRANSSSRPGRRSSAPRSTGR